MRDYVSTMKESEHGEISRAIFKLLNKTITPQNPSMSETQLCKFLLNRYQMLRDECIHLLTQLHKQGLILYDSGQIRPSEKGDEKVQLPSTTTEAILAIGSGLITLVLVSLFFLLEVPGIIQQIQILEDQYYYSYWVTRGLRSDLWLIQFFVGMGIVTSVLPIIGGFLIYKEFLKAGGTLTLIGIFLVTVPVSFVSQAFFYSVFYHVFFS